MQCGDKNEKKQVKNKKYSDKSSEEDNFALLEEKPQVSTEKYKNHHL